MDRRVPRALTALISLSLIVACKPPPVVAPDPEPAVDAGVPDAAPPVDAAGPVAAQVAPEACAAYVDHVLALGRAAMRANRPDELVPTDDQVADIRARLIAGAPCRELTPAEVACAMAATTQPGLYACAEASAR
ncbi:MAG: hypothetical protein R3B06_06695 [Kofleriaceae bacterium]